MSPANSTLIPADAVLPLDGKRVRAGDARRHRIAGGDRRFSHGRVLLLAGCGLFALAGCNDEGDGIRAYRAPKDPPPVMADAAAPGNAPAPVSEIAWDLPEGWTRESNPNAMRFATLSAGTGDSRIDVSIQQLAGDAGGLTANVQRWRSQLGLEPATEDELNDMTEAFASRNLRGFLVDITALTDATASSPPQRMLAAMFPTGEKTWFIKTTAPAPVIDTHREDFVALGRSIRLVEPSVSGPETAANASPSWKLPDGWVHEPTPRPMSVASFRIAERAQEAVLTITPLPGPPNTLDNIVRWRLQLGLEPIESLDDAPTAPIQVAGADGHYVDLIGATDRILGVIAPHDGTTWFYKLRGPADLLSKHKDAFEAFIRSIRFGGESNG